MLIKKNFPPPINNKKLLTKNQLIPAQTAETVADALYTHIFSRYGTMDVLVSDRSTNFCSALVSRLCQLLAIKRTKTGAYRPTGNSACERYNSTLLSALRCYLDKEEDWVRYLPAIAMAYRATSANASTEFSPFFIFYGREMRLGIDSELLATQVPGTTTADQYINKMIPKLKLIRQIAEENVKRHQIQYKARYDDNARTFSYKPGDKCWVYDPSTPKGKCKKLKLRWGQPKFGLG